MTIRHQKVGTLTIRQMSAEEVAACHFVPQAILSYPPSFFAMRGVVFHFGQDELDEFEVAELSLDDSVPFALMKYRGTPHDETTVFLASRVSLGEIGEVIGSIVGAFDLPPSAVKWQRTRPDTPY